MSYFLKINVMVSVKIGLKDDFKERFGIEEIVKTFT
jgi:hypothetical protein